MEFIPYGKQNISEDDIRAVTDVLKSDFLTQGPAVPEFEACIKNYVGVKYAVAVNSATSALHIACLALGVGEGDIVWTSPNTFVASSNCALYCGASVDFVDIDPDTYNMNVDQLELKLKQAKIDQKLPKVVIPVAFAGQSSDMKKIRMLADEYHFSVIEDASHAIGGSYLGEKIGSCSWADITILSFHPVKIITTAEGGMALTNSQDLSDKMQLLRSHGITRDEDKMEHSADGPWYYEQIELGFNYRMTDMQAALGISQMKRIDSFVMRRHEIATRYKLLLQDLNITVPYQHPDSYSALHLFPVVVKDCNKRKEIFNAMRKAGIGVNVHYIPVHTQPFYQRLGFKIGQFPQSEAYYAGAISLPMYATLTDEQQDYIIKTLKEAM